MSLILSLFARNSLVRKTGETLDLQADFPVETAKLVLLSDLSGKKKGEIQNDGKLRY